MLTIRVFGVFRAQCVVPTVRVAIRVSCVLSDLCRSSVYLCDLSLARPHPTCSARLFLTQCEPCRNRRVICLLSCAVYPVASSQPPVSRSINIVVAFVARPLICVIRALLIHVPVYHVFLARPCQHSANRGVTAILLPIIPCQRTSTRDDLSYFANHKCSFAHASVSYLNYLHSTGRPSIARERVVVLFVAGDVRRIVAFLFISSWS